MSIPAVNLRKRRVNRGLNLGDAAEQIGVPKTTLGRLERGENIPEPATGLKIARFYGLDVTDIWPLSEEEEVAA